MSIRQKLKIFSVGILCAAIAAPIPALAAVPEQGPKTTAKGSKGMVSSGHPQVSEAMLQVLKDGGNAIDAAITGLILEPVLLPQMTTLSGGMSMMIYDAKSKQLYYLDAELDHTRAGSPVGPAQTWSAGRNWPGPGLSETTGRRVGVPGTVAGLHAAAQRFGSMKWENYFTPAIKVAEEGFPMYSFLYGELADASLGRVAAIPSSREEFMPAGYPPPVGSIQKRPKLAETMKRLGKEGPEYFYRGDWAKNLVEFVGKAGGSMSMQDLADYKVYWEKPVRTTYNGYEIASSPPPATAGVLIGMVLNILENFDLKKMQHFSQSAETFALMRQAFSLAEFNSEAYVKDPRGFEVPVETLLSKEYAAMLAQLIKGSQPVAVKTAAAAPQHTVAMLEAGDRTPGMNTTHLVTADKAGNWVSATHTVYGGTFGVGVVDGVTLNGGNTFAGSAKGDGRRVISPFPPTVILKDGKPHMAIGSPGLSSRAVAQVLVNNLGFGMEMAAAIDAPRFRGAQPGTASLIETRVSEQMLAGLPDYDVPAQLTAPYNWHQGSVHAIVRDGRNFLGYADPRRAGLALGY